MKQLIGPLALAFAACLLLLAGCRDRHEPVKPTVAAVAPKFPPTSAPTF